MAQTLGERDHREVLWWGRRCEWWQIEIQEIIEAEVTHILCSLAGGEQAELPQVLRWQWQTEGLLCDQGAPDEAAILSEYHIISALRILLYLYLQ